MASNTFVGRMIGAALLGVLSWVLIAATIAGILTTGA